MATNILKDEKKLKEILAASGYIAQKDLDRATADATERHLSLTEWLVSQQMLTKELLGQAIAEYYKIPYANLEALQPAREQVIQIPEEVARLHKAVVFKQDEISVTIATSDPSSQALVKELKNFFPLKLVRLVFALPEDVDHAFVHYKKTLDTRFAKIIKQEHRAAPELAKEILNDALLFQASDIHFEPREQEVIVRFRVDGILHEAGRLENKYYENIVNRIKVLARLRTDEHFAPQDGAFRHIYEDRTADVRVSIIPILDGEKIAARLLTEYVRDITLQDLGFLEEHERMVRDAIKKPFGMILTTGPTGSGKTTTLYSITKILNTPNVNISTIEDPVEYKIVGVNQIQVDAARGITFTSGLRSIVRQDPNIVLVGEIRDGDTAEISINAALTGQLLLSSFHANDAATVIPRLLYMGIQPYLLASTLELVMAQRLVRRICEACRVSISEDTAIPQHISKKLSGSMDILKNMTFYAGKGCDSCNKSGYRGRIAVFELIPASSEVRELIASKPSAHAIRTLMRKRGLVSMFQDGMEKVKRGLTTLEEVVRVTEPPSSNNDVQS